MIRRAVQFALGLALSLFFSNLTLAAAPGTSAYRVCVLNYERAEHPITSVINHVFVGAKNLKLVNMASPLDLLDCVRQRYNEILIVGHAIELPTTHKNGPVNLGYFRELHGQERQSAISKLNSTLSTRLSAVNAALEQTNAPEKRRQLTELKSKILGAISKYHDYPASQPYVILNPILPRIMRRIHQELKSQAASPKGIALKRIRLMSCLPDQVLEEYDDLRALIRDYSIDLDIAPSNTLMSWIEGQSVTSPDMDWLAQSVDCSQLQEWRTGSNSDCKEDWWSGCDRQTAHFCIPVNQY